MSQVTVSHVISSLVADVWATLADFGSIHRYAAGIESSPINEGTSTGVGAERNCQPYDGNNLMAEEFNPAAMLQGSNDR